MENKDPMPDLATCKRRGGWFRVCREPDLDFCTENGYELVQAFKMSTVHTINETVAIPPSQYNSCPSTQMVTKSYVVDELRFVLCKSENTALADLTAQVYALRKRAEGDAVQAAISTKSLAEATRDLEQSRMKESLAGRRVAELSALLDTVRAQVRTYESDLAKVRAAIGELKMKEIVAGNDLQNRKG
jgi:hypothetical protein